MSARGAKIDPTMLGLVGPFTKIARSMSENHRVQIVPDGFRVCTNGDIIRIPFTADFLPADRRQVLEGMLDHEVCHVTEEREHRAALRPTPVELMTREKNKTMRMLLNVFEDIRIEHKWSRRYPGVAENLRTMNEDFVARFRADKKYHKTFWHKLGSAIIMKARGMPFEWAGEQIAEYLDLIDAEVREATRTEWAQDCYELAARVYEKIREAAEDTLERDKKAKKKKDKKKEDKAKSKEEEESKDPSGESSEDGEGEPGAPGESSGSESGDDEEDDEAEVKPKKGKRPGDDDADDDDDASDGSEGGEDEAGDEDASDDSEEDDEDEADDEDGDDEGEGGGEDEADDEHEPDGDGGEGGDDDDEPGPLDEDDDEPPARKPSPRPRKPDPEPEDGDEDDDEAEDASGESSSSASDDGGEAGDPEPSKADVAAASEALTTESEIEDFGIITAEEVEKMVRADAREHSRYVPDPEVRKLDKWFAPTKLLGMPNYIAARDEVAGQIGALRAKQLAYIQTLTRKRTVSGLDQGRLDETMLSDVRLGSRHVFAETVKGIDLDTAIEALVDLSGSMSSGDTKGCAAYYAKRTAIALAESWEPLKVPYEIIGFHNAHSRSRGLGFRSPGGDPDTVHRAPFDFMIFKAWNERLAQTRERFTAIYGHEDNADGEAVWAAACRLAVRPEKRKILIVISDGYPAHAGVDSGKLNAHLKAVVTQITRAGIEVIGFGAGTEAPKQFYNKSTGASNVIVKDLNQLAVTMFTVMRERLLRAA